MIYTPEQLRANPWAFNHHPEQARYEKSTADIQVTAAGRRSGKTEINARKIVKTANAETDWPDWRGFIGAPTWQQAKDLYWKRLQKLIPSHLMIGEPNKSELYIRLWNNAEIHVEGLDKMSRIVGQPWNYMVIDEVDDTKYKEIEEEIMPMMSDRQAPLCITGVPNGRAFLYEMSQRYPNSYYHWKSADVFPLYMGEERAKKEIRKAKSRMDLMTYLQEYEASFDTLTNRVYYAYEPKLHEVEGLKEKVYTKKSQIIFTFDFNVSPGTAGVGLEKNGIMNAIDEVHIKDNSTTPMVCRKLIQKYGDHEGNVVCYGDPTGGNRGSAKTEGSDWELIRDTLKPVFGRRLHFKVKSHHPPQRDLINAMNGRFKTANGKIHFLTDTRNKYTNEDFYSVQVVEGSAGEIDKKQDPAKTHHSDGWMHWADYEYPKKRKDKIYSGGVTS
jgi:hypothetical protein